MTNIDRMCRDQGSVAVPDSLREGATFLVVESPLDLRGIQLPLPDTAAVVGREGDLVVPSPTVSKHHARTWWHGGVLWIEDCGSKNGTLVNGLTFDAAMPLRAGDRVTLGDVECRIMHASQDYLPKPSPIKPARPWLASSPTQPMPRAETETTRYLCAATHLDEAFGDRVIRHTVDQSYRAVAPSLGVDIAAVATHALAARRRRFVRDLLLLATLLAALVTAVIPLTSPANIAVLQATDRSSAELLISVLLPILLLFGALAGLVIAGETWVTRLLVLTRQLSNRRFKPDAIPAPWGRRARDRLARLAAAQHGNVTIFRGFHPFVGAGVMVNNWSFAVDISKGSSDPKTGERRLPQPFDAADLHDYLGDALRSLSLPGLIITDRLFVHGSDVWQDRRLLPDRRSAPIAVVPHATVRDMLRESDPISRPYLCAEAAAWHGQLVQTTFLRAVKLYDSLYIEGAAFTLPPLRSKYYTVDTLVPCGPLEAAAAGLGIAVTQTLPLLLASPVRVIRAISTMSRASRTETQHRRQIDNGWHFDYGTATSIREMASGLDTRRYFLKADGEMFETVVQERLLRGLIDFLSDHDIDVDQAKNFQQTINNGNVYSGTFNMANSQNAFNSGNQANYANSAPKPHAR